MDSDATGSAITGAGSGAATGAMVGGPWGAVIGAGVGMIGGLLGASARRDAERRRREFEGTMMGLQTQANAAQNWTAANQNALATMVQGYGKALGGK